MVCLEVLMVLPFYNNLGKIEKIASITEEVSQTLSLILFSIA